MSASFLSGVMARFVQPGFFKSNRKHVCAQRLPQGVRQDGTHRLWEALEPRVMLTSVYSTDLGVHAPTNQPTPEYAVTAAAATSANPSFVQVPGQVIAGRVVQPSIIIEVLDDNGNLNMTSGVSVTLSIASGVGTLSGTLTVTTVNGVATFKNVTIDTAGSYTLRATIAGVSTTSNSVTASTAPTVFGPGVLGNAMLFDGAGNNIDVEMGNPADGHLGLDVPEATIEAWVQFNTLQFDSISTIASQSEGAGNKDKWIFGYANNYFGTSATVLHFNTTEGDYVELASNTWTPVAGQWYHLAVVKNGNTYTFYRNGVADGTATASESFPKVNGKFTLGQTDGDFWLKGGLDEVRMWNVARTGGQISGAMNTPIVGAETGLRAGWSMNETSGTTIADVSVFHTTGTIRGLTGLDVPVLNSLPGAKASIYLNFTGDYVPVWGGVPGYGIVPAYDMDGIGNAFNAAELDAIYEAWAGVAEIYSAFNINVTTVDPGIYTAKTTAKIDIGWLGEPGVPGVAGVALLNQFGTSSDVWDHTGYAVSMAKGIEIVRVAAHEAGHIFGLQHQSTYDDEGFKILEYSMGDEFRQPIMGHWPDAGTVRGLWNYGPNSISASTFQDDLAVLAGAVNGFGYRPDDVGNNKSAATPLTISANGSLTASGVITTISDVDYFSFKAVAGVYDIKVDPAAIAGMLDPTLELRDSTGALVLRRDTASLAESLSVTLPSGTYYLVVGSKGIYGDIGQYTLTVTTTASNAAPSFTKGADFVLNEDAPAQLVNGWATNISANDTGQTVSFLVTSDNTDLFALGGQPVISANGTLSFTPAANAFGTATITVILMDDGGTANAGSDTSAAQTFTITVNPVNDAPSFLKGGDQLTANDMGLQTVAGWATSISLGAANEASQKLTFVVTNDNNALFAVQPTISPDGTLTYTPAGNASGTATITVTAMDNGGVANGGIDTSGSQTFSIKIVPHINVAPTFTASNPPVVLEDAGKQVVANWAKFNPGSSKETDQTNLGYTLSGVSNPALFTVLPSIDANGTLTYTSAPNVYGSSSFTIKVKDSGGTANGGVDTSTTQTFTINVTSVPDAPSIGSLNLGAPGYGGIEPARFTASNISSIDAPVTKVGFYHDSNKNNVAEASELLGYGKQNGSQWVLDLYTPAGPIGSNTILAVAIDTTGVQSQPVAGSFYIYRYQESNNAIQWVDSNGNTVKASVTGGGSIKGYFIDDTHVDASKLVITGTTAAKSILNIAVTKGKGSTTDQTTIGEITVSSGLMTFSGAKVNLTGSFLGSSYIKTLSLNDVVNADQGAIKIGGTATDKTSLSFGRLSNVSVTSLAAISSFKALDWKDTDATQDFLAAASVGTLTISGRAANAAAKLDKLNGDLDADISLSWDGAGSKTALTTSITIAGSATGNWDLKAHVLSTASIKGDVSHSTWTSNAGFGSITITGTADMLTINTPKDITSFKAGHVQGTTIKNDGTLGGVNVLDWSGGSIITGKLGGLTTTGRVLSKTASAIAGDFTGRVFVSGISALATAKSTGAIAIKGSAIGDGTDAADWQFFGGVGSITISGNATNLEIIARNLGANVGHVASLSVAGTSLNSSLDASGKVGAVTVGTFDHSGINAVGDITSFTAKSQVLNSTVATEANLGAVTSLNWLGGLIEADKVGTITTKGQATPAISGDFTGSLIITGQGVASTASALGAVTIAGAVSNATWSVVGKASAITAGAFSNSNIMVNADLASFTSKGQVQNTNLTSHGNIGAITSLNWLGGSITAIKVASVTTKGQAAAKGVAAINGDFSGTVSVLGDGGKLNAMGNVTIAGTLINSAWNIAGNSGTVTVGAVSNSSYFVGVNALADAGVLPVDKSQFTLPGAALAGFTVTGKAVANASTIPSFVNSRIAAGTLTLVSLKLVDMAEADDNGFAAATKIVAYSRQTGPLPTNVLKVANQTLAKVYDPKDGTGDTGYRLEIID